MACWNQVATCPGHLSRRRNGTHHLKLRLTRGFLFLKPLSVFLGSSQFSGLSSVHMAIGISPVLVTISDQHLFFSSILSSYPARIRIYSNYTPWSRVLEKLTGSQLVKKFLTFYGTRRFIAAFTSARHLSLS